MTERMNKYLELIVLTILIHVSLCELNKCNFNVKIKQALLGEGFHRNITYGLTFNDDDQEGDWLYQKCIVALEQTLPPGVFVNPDELSDLRRTYNINVFPKNRVNVESPTEQSSPSSVYIIGKVIDHHSSLWLPVHARYHEAVAGGGTARNEIIGPNLYLRCPDERLHLCDIPISSASTSLCNGSSKERCDWKEIPYTLVTDTLVWEIPVGNTDHYYIVSYGTGIVVIVGSLYILKIIHEYKIEKRKPY